MDSKRKTACIGVPGIPGSGLCKMGYLFSSFRSSYLDWGQAAIIYLFPILIMKKFLLRSIVFLGLMFLIIFFVARYDNADKYSNNDHNVLKIAHLSAFDSLNILFLGNSFCYSSIYNPLFDSMGIRTFNLGIASAGPKFYSMLLDDYFSEIKRKPDTIMLLITPMSFSGKADNW